jgi:hypothetical protein
MTGPVHWWPGKDSWRVLSGPEEGWSRSRSSAVAGAYPLFPKVLIPGPKNGQ